MSAVVEKAVADIVHILEPRATTEEIVRIAYLQGQIDGLREMRSHFAPRRVIDGTAECPEQLRGILAPDDHCQGELGGECAGAGPLS